MLRIWNKVKKTPTCWEWTGAGANSVRGYGLFWYGGKLQQAHRVVYTLLVGEIPEGLQLDHLCRNKSCVNPNHLEPVTARVNTLRSDGITAKLALRTHCKNGHEFNSENTSFLPNRRRCKICNRSIAKKYYYKQKTV